MTRFLELTLPARVMDELDQSSVFYYGGVIRAVVKVILWSETTPHTGTGTFVIRGTALHQNAGLHLVHLFLLILAFVVISLLALL